MASHTITFQHDHPPERLVHGPGPARSRPRAGPRIGLRFVMDVEPRDGGSAVTFFVRLGIGRELAKRPQQFREALAGS